MVGGDLISCHVKILEKPSSLPVDLVDSYAALGRLCTQNASAIETSYRCHQDAIFKFLERDLNKNESELAQGVLHFIGSLFQSKLNSFLSYQHKETLLSMVIRTLDECNDRGVCWKGLHLIVKQELPLSIVKEKAKSVLSTLRALLTSASCSSPSVEQEALAVISKLLKQCHSEMEENVELWIDLVYPFVVSATPQVAHAALCILKDENVMLVKKGEHVNKSLVPDLKRGLLEELKTLFQENKETFVLDVWSCLVSILGQTMHKGGCLTNDMLKITEKAFKSSSNDVLSCAFKAWKALITNYASSSSSLCSSPKRLKLLMMPLMFPTSKTRHERVELARFDAWWHLICLLGDSVNNCFGDVIMPFLNLSFKIGYSPAEQTNGNTTPEKTRSDEESRNLLQSPLAVMTFSGLTPKSLNSKSSTLHVVFDDIKKKGAEALLQLLGGAQCDGYHLLENYQCSIDTFPGGRIQAAIFRDNCYPLFAAVQEALASPFLEESLTMSLWMALVNTTKSVLLEDERFLTWYGRLNSRQHLLFASFECSDNLIMISHFDVVSTFIMRFIEAVKEKGRKNRTNKACIGGLILILQKLSESNDVSADLFTGMVSYCYRELYTITPSYRDSLKTEDNPHGLLSIVLLSMFPTDKFIDDGVFDQSQFHSLWNFIVQTTLSDPVNQLQHMQSLLGFMQQICSVIKDHECLFTIWRVMIEKLVHYVKETNEVNQGDALSCDYSCIVAVLMFPFRFCHFDNLSQDVMSSTEKSFMSLFSAFKIAAELVPTATLNSAVNELSKSLIGLLQSQRRVQIQEWVPVKSYTGYLSHNYQDIQYSYIAQPRLLLSPRKLAKSFGQSKDDEVSLFKLTPVLMKAALRENEMDQRSRDALVLKTFEFIDNIIESSMTAYYTKSLIKEVSPVILKVLKLEKQSSSPSNKKSSDEWIKYLTVDGKRTLSTKIFNKLCSVVDHLYRTVEKSCKDAFDKELLDIMKDLLASSLSSEKKQLKKPTVRFWNSTFGKSKIELDCSVPSMAVLAALSDTSGRPSSSQDEELTQFPDSGSNSQLSASPKLKITTTPHQSPHKIRGSFLSFISNGEQEGGLTSTTKALFPSPKKSPLKSMSRSPKAERRKILNIDEASSSEFVRIESPPKKKRLLTEHQKEVMLSKRNIPALYNDLDVSQDINVFSVLTQDNSQKSQSEVVKDNLKLYNSTLQSLDTNISKHVENVTSVEDSDSNNNSSKENGNKSNEVNDGSKTESPNFILPHSSTELTKGFGSNASSNYHESPDVIPCTQSQEEQPMDVDDPIISETEEYKNQECVKSTEVNTGGVLPERDCKVETEKEILLTNSADLEKGREGHEVESVKWSKVLVEDTQTYSLIPFLMFPKKETVDESDEDHTDNVSVNESSKSACVDAEDQSDQGDTAGNECSGEKSGMRDSSSLEEGDNPTLSTHTEGTKGDKKELQSVYQGAAAKNVNKEDTATAIVENDPDLQPNEGSKKTSPVSSRTRKRIVPQQPAPRKTRRRSVPRSEPEEKATDSKQDAAIENSDPDHAEDRASDTGKNENIEECTSPANSYMKRRLTPARAEKNQKRQPRRSTPYPQRKRRSRLSNPIEFELSSVSEESKQNDSTSSNIETAMEEGVKENDGEAGECLRSKDAEQLNSVNHAATDGFTLDELANNEIELPPVGASKDNFKSCLPALTSLNKKTSDSPGMSPVNGILKRRKGGKLDSPSTPNKNRRVSFALPLESKSSSTHEDDNELARPLQDGENAEKGAKSSRQYTAIKAKSSAKSQTTGPAIFPDMVTCTAPIEQILPSLTPTALSRGLGHLVRAQNILTVGNLSALSELQIQNLPIRSPKVRVVKDALRQYASQSKKFERKTTSSKDNTDAASKTNHEEDASEISTTPPKRPLPELSEEILSSLSTPSRTHKDPRPLSLFQAPESKGNAAADMANTSNIPKTVVAPNDEDSSKVANDSSNSPLRITLHCSENLDEFEDGQYTQESCSPLGGECDVNSVSNVSKNVEPRQEECKEQSNDTATSNTDIEMEVRCSEELKIDPLRLERYNDEALLAMSLTDLFELQEKIASLSLRVVSALKKKCC